MRRYMETQTRARVVLGGTTAPKKGVDDKAGYGGRYPGVVEEAWRTLTHGKPLYVAAGFGGAAALVASALESDDPSRELDDKTWADNAAWVALSSELDGDPDFKRLKLPGSQADLHKAIYALGHEYLTSDDLSVRWNGLTVAENRELFATRDPLTVVALVLKGLIAVSTIAAEGKLRVELVEGDVSCATDLELLVFPTFSDLTLDGAGAALDRVSGGAATRAHTSRSVVSSGSSALGAEFLYAANLGGMTSALKNEKEATETAAADAARVIRRHGFKRVGIVTFLGNVATNLSDVVGAMLRGLGYAAQTADFVWFEKDPERAARVAQVLGAAPDKIVLTRRMAPVPGIPVPAGKNRTVVAVRHDESRLDVALLFHQSNGLAPVVLTPFDEAARLTLANTDDRAAPATAEIESRGKPDRAAPLRGPRRQRCSAPWVTRSSSSCTTASAAASPTRTMQDWMVQRSIASRRPRKQRHRPPLARGGSRARARADASTAGAEARRPRGDRSSMRSAGRKKGGRGAGRVARPGRVRPEGAPWTRSDRHESARGYRGSGDRRAALLRTRGSSTRRVPTAAD